MNEYTKMIAEARKNGLSTERALWCSISTVERLLDQMSSKKESLLSGFRTLLDMETETEKNTE